MRMSFNPAALAAEVRHVTEKPAERIAQKARRRYQQHELKTDDPRMGVMVEAKLAGHRVVTYNPFAALDEFGGPNVYSVATGAMRSAAVEEGRFEPAPKP